MTDLARKLAEIKNNIAAAAARCGRKQPVELLAVTKTVPVETIAQAAKLGQTAFGESRVQEALPKIERLPWVEWHLIGRLQTNKVRKAVGKFSLIHSLDRWKLAEALQEEAERQDRTVRVLLQVNIGREPQKGGLDPGEAEEFLREASSLSRLKIEGLMAIPPLGEDPEESRPYFREMFALYSKLRESGAKLSILSLGMSNDYIVAVEEGANLVRIGSLLFGERTR